MNLDISEGSVKLIVILGFLILVFCFICSLRAVLKSRKYKDE